LNPSLPKSKTVSKINEISRKCDDHPQSIQDLDFNSDPESDYLLKPARFEGAASFRIINSNTSKAPIQ